MRTSDDLPTAVDYTNILVNYIEVSADDVPAPTRTTEEQVPPGVFPPQVLPPTTEVKDHAQHVVQREKPVKEQDISEPKHYAARIPKYLLDLDQPEDSPQYQRAVGAIGDLPQPPSLPLFLGKSILNGTTPMKDDSSVLNMPNYTVLNHLATSSIKNGVLATSGTTRYKRKVRYCIPHLRMCIILMAFSTLRRSCISRLVLTTRLRPCSFLSLRRAGDDRELIPDRSHSQLLSLQG